MYNIYGFLEKNKDTLFQDFKRLLYSSNNSLIKDMWPEGALDIKSVRRISVKIISDFILVIIFHRQLNDQLLLEMHLKHQ